MVRCNLSNKLRCILNLPLVRSEKVTILVAWHHLPYFTPLTSFLSHFTTIPQINHTFALQEVENRNVETIDITQTAHWTRCIHKLCTVDRDVDSALHLLHQLCLRGFHPDSLNISSIIHALCNVNRFSEAHERLFLFVSSQNTPDECTCNVLIARLLDGHDLPRTMRLINSLINVKPDFVPTLENYNRLVDGFCKLGKMELAHWILYHMMMRGHCPNVVSYTTLINGYCRNGNVIAAEKVFNEMSESGVHANALTYSALVHGVLRTRDLQKGKSLIGKAWEVMGREVDMLVNNAAFCSIIDCLCKEGLFHEVFNIAEDMPQGSHVLEELAYAHMVDSFCRFERYNGAARIIYMMRERGFIPSLVSYNSIVHGLCKDGDFFRAYQLFEEGMQFGYYPSLYTYTILVEGLCREYDLVKAKEVLNVMLNKEGADGTRIHNIYLRALCHMNNPTELLNVLVSMLQSQCQPDIVSLNTVIKGFCQMRRVEEALQVLDDMTNGKFCAPDGVTYCTIINGLLNVGKATEAVHFLRNIMPEKGCTPGVVTYNAALRGLFKLGLANEAMKVFNDMVCSSGMTADCITHTVVIEGLCQFSRMEDVKRFWNDVVWPSGVHDNFVYSAMLKGLCYSDNFNEACDLLYELADFGVKLNNVNYNIVLDYACKMGFKREAYQIIRDMKNNGVMPDAVTWRTLNRLQDSV